MGPGGWERSLQLQSEVPSPGLSSSRKVTEQRHEPVSCTSVVSASVSCLQMLALASLDDDL